MKSKQITYFTLRALTLVFLVFFSFGCVKHYMPKDKFWPADEWAAVPWEGEPIAVINGQEDNSEHKIGGGPTRSTKMNLYLWTQFLCDRMVSDFQDMGVEIDPNSSKKLFIKIEDYEMKSKWVFHFTLTVKVWFSDGSFEKVYVTKATGSHDSSGFAPTIQEFAAQLFGTKEFVEYVFGSSYTMSD